MSGKSMPWTVMATPGSCCSKARIGECAGAVAEDAHTQGCSRSGGERRQMAGGRVGGTDGSFGCFEQ